MLNSHPSRCSEDQDPAKELRRIDSLLNLTDPATNPDSVFDLLLKGAAVAARIPNLDVTTGYLNRVDEFSLFKADPGRRGRAYLTIADLLLGIRQYDESMQYCQLALPLLDEALDLQGKAKILIIMYNNAHHTTDLVDNKNYLAEAGEIAKQLNDSSLLWEVHLHSGLDYYRNSEFQEAIRKYDEARQYILDQNSSEALSTAIHQHLIYTIVDSTEAAGRLSEFIVRSAQETGQVVFLRNGYRGRAWYYAKHGIKDSVNHYLDLAEKNLREYGQPDATPGFLYSLYEVSMIINDHQRAVSFLHEAHRQYQELVRTDNAKILSEIRGQFDFELQKERIEKLLLENQLKQETNRRQLTILITVLCILILTTITLILIRRQYQRLRETYRVLVEKNLEMDQTERELALKEEIIQERQLGRVIPDEDEIYLKIRSLLNDDKIFKQQDLSLTNLAAMLGTNTTYLSGIINGRFGMNFKSLLNKYRINEARRLLVSDDFRGYSIEGIANEVGYQSRSTFYREFREVMGITPKEYMEGYKQIQDRSPA
jgi:AraC-like DNA-binding protein